ncbi:MAG: hypothetical protein NVS9B4_22750 [Candidatus Acidiferrum sp.]
MHAEMRIGDSIFFLGDEFPGMSAAPAPGSIGSCQLNLYTENVDAVYQKAVDAGSKPTMPLQDQFWGDRYGKLVDPFGHTWGLAQHIEDVAPDEMERRAKEWQSQMA